MPFQHEHSFKDQNWQQITGQASLYISSADYHEGEITAETFQDNTNRNTFRGTAYENLELI